MVGSEANGAWMMRPDNQTLQGIAYVILAAASFATLDTTTKFVSYAVPFAVVMWFRFFFQIVTMLGWLKLTRGSVRMVSNNLRLQMYRGGLLTASSILAFFSLKLIPVADFTALMMLTPLIMTVVAATSLQEPISPLRWVLVLMGFVGAIVVIRPGHETFTWASLIPLILVGTSTGFQILTYRLAQVDDAMTTHWFTGLIGLATATVTLPFVAMDGLQMWQQSGLSLGTLLAALLTIAVMATVGHGALIMGYSRAPVATLTPYLYAQIPFAVLGGWLVFAHELDGWTGLGIGIIALSGVLGTWVAARERKADLRVILDN
jgi:drug/metabolite transporter (DMT)-like permease